MLECKHLHQDVASPTDFFLLIYPFSKDDLKLKLLKIDQNELTWTTQAYGILKNLEMSLYIILIYK